MPKINIKICFFAKKFAIIKIKMLTFDTVIAKIFELIFLAATMKRILTLSILALLGFSMTMTSCVVSKNRYNTAVANGRRSLLIQRVNSVRQACEVLEEMQGMEE